MVEITKINIDTIYDSTKMEVVIGSGDVMFIISEGENNKCIIISKEDAFTMAKFLLRGE